MVIEADNSLNSLRNRRSKTAQAGLRPAYVFPSAISKGGGAHAHAPPHATPLPLSTPLSTTTTRYEQLYSRSTVVQDKHYL